MDTIDKLLNATKVLRENMPKLIEVFTMYYGEENREYIEKRFNDIMVLCFHKNELMLEIFDRALNKKKGDKAAQLINEAFLKYDVPVNDYFSGIVGQYSYREEFDNYYLVKVKQYIENVKLDDKYNKILKYVPGLDYNSFIEGKLTDKEIELIPKEVYEGTDELLESYNKYPHRRQNKSEIVHIASFIYDDVYTTNIDEMILNGRFDTVHKLCMEIVKTREEEYLPFVALQSKLDNVVSYFEKEEEMRKKIHDKHFLEFVKEYKYLLSNSDQKALDMVETDEDIELSLVNGLDYVLPESLDSSLSMEYFRKEYDEMLKSPDTPEFLVDIIKKARVNYFIFKGIDIGEEYEDYEKESLIEDSIIKKEWPSEELIDRVKKSYLEYKEKYEDEVFNYYLCYPDYKEYLEEANKIGLLNKGALYSPAYCMQDIFKACVCPNVVKEGDKYKLFSQVSIGISSLDYLDETIIHELNHVYESHLIDCNDKVYKTSSGWDVTETEIGQDIVRSFDTNASDGKYTAFNEIINELIAQQITDMMHEKGIFIFSNPSTAKSKGSSGYEYTAFLAKDFLDEYYDTIIASRRNNNMKLIIDKVGRDNFEDLNDLFYEFHNMFPGAEPGYLEMDLQDNKETVLTKKYSSLVEKRDKILDNMREYVKSHSTKLD